VSSDPIRNKLAAVIAFSLAVVVSYEDSLPGRLKRWFSFLVGTKKFAESPRTGLLAGGFKFLAKTTLVRM
jgi:hypothetical protein